MKRAWIHCRVEPLLLRRLHRLRSERDINVSAWIRSVLSRELERLLGPDPDGEALPLPPSPPLQGWRPALLPDGEWGARYSGPPPQDLPADLVALTIAVQTRSGNSWNATVTQVVERSSDRLLVRTQKLDQ